MGLIYINMNRCDVLYFLYSSTTPETREKHMHQLLKNYFAIVCDSLKLLGIDLQHEGYGEERFLDDCKKRSIWGLLMGLIVAPIALNKKVVGELHSVDEEMRTNQPEKTGTFGLLLLSFQL
jgi:Ecdysteroid kinase-like family